jgi:hypothetical protein
MLQPELARWQELENRNKVLVYWNDSLAVGGLGRCRGSHVARLVYRNRAGLKVDVHPSKRRRFGWSHSGVKLPSHPRVKKTIIVQPPRKDPLPFLCYKRTEESTPLAVFCNPPLTDEKSPLAVLNWPSLIEANFPHKPSR